MPMLCIKNGTVVLKDALLRKSDVLIDGGRIAAVGRDLNAKPCRRVINARGCYISPGFIDTHIHGDPAEIFFNEPRTGTTSIVVAISCDRLDRIYNAVDAVKNFTAEDPLGPNLLGVRLEGPYISRRKAGAQNKKFIKKPDRHEAERLIKRCGRLLRIMTIAPELKGAIVIIRFLTKQGIIASLGHSDARFDETQAGINAGMRHATHLFNCMGGVNARQPGAAGAMMLDGRTVVEVILDGVHVHGSLFRLLLSSKALGSIILITDSVRADRGSGTRKSGGVYRLKDGTIAGSSLTMIRAVKNAVRIGRLKLIDAVNMATLNPARLLRVNRRKGSIAVGMDADLVLFDKNFDVKMTIAGGMVIYRKKGF